MHLCIIRALRAHLLVNIFLLHGNKGTKRRETVTDPTSLGEIVEASLRK